MSLLGSGGFDHRLARRSFAGTESLRRVTLIPIGGVMLFLVVHSLVRSIVLMLLLHDWSALSDHFVCDLIDLLSKEYVLLNDMGYLRRIAHRIAVK